MTRYRSCVAALMWRAATVEHTNKRLKRELAEARRVLTLGQQAYRRVEAAEASARRVLEIERAQRLAPRTTTFRPTDPTDKDAA